MNKIERAISDCKYNIKKLEQDKLIVLAVLDAYKKQLDDLERINANKTIPHQELFDKKLEQDNQ